MLVLFNLSLHGDVSFIHFQFVKLFSPISGKIRVICIFLSESKDYIKALPTISWLGAVHLETLSKITITVIFTVLIYMYIPLGH